MSRRNCSAFIHLNGETYRCTKGLGHRGRTHVCRFKGDDDDSSLAVTLEWASFEEVRSTLRSGCVQKGSLGTAIVEYCDECEYGGDKLKCVNYRRLSFAATFKEDEDGVKVDSSGKKVKC